jgi:hypothetical protein
MKKYLTIGIIFVVVLAITLVIYSPKDISESLPEENCTSKGKLSSTLNCCEGLDKFKPEMLVSVEDECYTNPISLVADIVSTPICLDCGNGICEAGETVCICPEDCAGKGKSDYLTVENFCNDTQIYDCHKDYTKGMPLCQLCVEE